MKYQSLLVFSMALAAIAVSCSKENTSEGSAFTGIEVEVGENAGSRLLVLNQGSFPGASTLDLLDFKTRQYYADVFGQANPGIPQGVGNTANDMAVVGGTLWVALNASNQVSVLDLNTFKLLKTITVDSPRYMVCDGNYVYVSSYGAAVNGSVYGVPGKVYQINTATYESKSVEVGHQPEGLAFLDGKLYVANSGGYELEHEKTLSVIDPSAFTVSGTLTLPVENLNRLFAADGKLWVSTYDSYNADWSAVTVPMSLGSVSSDGTYTQMEGVSPMTVCLEGHTLYAADFTHFYTVDTATGTVRSTPFAGSDLSRISYPYGLAVNPLSGDIYVADASFTGDSKIHCFSSTLRHRWSVTAGLGTCMLKVL